MRSSAENGLDGVTRSEGTVALGCPFPGRQVFPSDFARSMPSETFGAPLRRPGTAEPTTRELIALFVAAALRTDPSIAEHAAMNIARAQEDLIGTLATQIEALLHRPSDYRETILRTGPLELDLVEHSARRGNRRLDLLPREFKLLKYLMHYEGQLVTRAMVFQELWNYRFVPESNLVDVHLGHLRRKVDARDEVQLIHSIRGAGFMLRAPRQTPTPSHDAFR